MISTPNPRLSYQPWCVVRSLPNTEKQIAARFHRRSDADGYLRVMRQRFPHAEHEIVFQAAINPELN